MSVKGVPAMAALVKDVVCGMEVDPDGVLSGGVTRYSHEGQRYYFCSLRCRNKFVANPDAYLNPKPEEAKS